MGDWRHIPLEKRMEIVLDWKDNQHRSFSELGREWGLTSDRVSQIYYQAKRRLAANGSLDPPRWSVRICNVLWVHNLETDEEIRQWILSGKYKNARNLGPKSVQQICDALDIDPALLKPNPMEAALRRRDQLLAMRDRTRQKLNKIRNNLADIENVIKELEDPPS